MRFLAVLLASLAAVGPVSAQAVDGRSGETEWAVRLAVAEAWGAAPEDIVLEWGRDEPDFSRTAAVELVGSGSGGTWVARLTDDDGNVVAERVRAGRRARLPVAGRRLSRGTVLTGSDVELQDVVEWGPANESLPVRFDGWVTQRIMEKGDVLAEPAVRAPRAVSPGSTVALRVRSGRVRVDAVAVAAGAGSIGDQVDVRTESGRRVRGVVVGPGVVDVTRAGADNLNGGSR